MATLTAVFDPVLVRVGLTIGGFTDGTPVAITRDGVPVRGASAVIPSSGSYFVWDYEAPLNQVAHYAADDGTLTATANVLVDSTDPMLRAPGLPALDRVITPESVPVVSRPRPTAVLRPIGRRAPVVLSGTRSAGEFTLTVWAKDANEAQDLLTLSETTAVCLLAMPGSRGTEHVYVVIGDIEEQPITGFLGEDYTRWTLSCVVVDSPIGDVFGDATASYQAIVDTHLTYTALLAANPTYLDVLRGV